MEIYKITWKDHASESKWQDKKEIKGWVDTLKPCTTVGYITYKSRKHIVLCGSHDGEDHYGECMLIFTNLIEKINEVREV